MKRNIILHCIFAGVVFFAFCPVFSRPIDIGTVQQVASTHIDAQRAFSARPSSHSIQPTTGDRKISLIAPIYSNKSNEIIAHVVHIQPVGYVVVAADTDIRPIIAYSYKNDFLMSDSPQNILLQMIKRDIENRIKAKPLMNREIIRENNILWEKYAGRNKSLMMALHTADTYGPFLDTQWSQGDFYGAACPIDPETSERCPCGCTATAFGGLINFWEYPTSMIFDSSDSYWSRITTPEIWVDAPAASIDTIDYNGVDCHPTETAIGALLYACGIVIEMQYSSDGSSASTTVIPEALLTKFDYASAENRTGMSTMFWYMLEDNVTDALPALIGVHISDTSIDGHAMVVDGYRTSGEYHLNVGWGGYADGWYYLPDYMPAGYDIIDNGVLNILPSVVTRRQPENLTAETISGGFIHLDWEVPTLITESVLHYNVYRKMTSEDVYTLLGSTTSLEHTDSTIGELTEYIYGVSACYDLGESPYANVKIYSNLLSGWARPFGDNSSETAYSVAPTDDGGCIAAGYKETLQKDIFVVRISSEGDEVWETVIGGENDDCAYSIIQTSDGGYAIAGMTASIGMGGMDIWLLKMNADGDTTWTKTYGSVNDDEGMAIAQTPDGGFIITGYSNDGTADKICLIKTNSDGDTTWTRAYGENHYGYSVINTFDEGYIIAGYTESGPHGNYDAYLLKTDAVGESLWACAYGGAMMDIARAVTQDDDGGFVVAGITRSFGFMTPLFSNLFAFKTNAVGDTVWTRAFGGSGNDFAYSILKTMDNTFILTGSYVVSGNTDLYLVELDSDGDSLMARAYGTGGVDVGYSLIQLCDSSLIIAGSTTYLFVNNDFWVLKIRNLLPAGIHMQNSKLPVNRLFYVYPNPFNSNASIKYELEWDSHVALDVYDIAGHHISTLIDERQSAGDYIADWIAPNSAPSGVYLIRLKTDIGIQSKKVILIR